MDLDYISNLRIYDAKSVEFYLRENFNLNIYDSYSFSFLAKLLKKQCEQRNIFFFDRVEFENNKIVKLFPLLDCGEKLVQISIYHKFGELCFVDYPRLPVKVILNLLKYDPLCIVCDEYDIGKELVRKVQKEYVEKPVDSSTKLGDKT